MDPEILVHFERHDVKGIKHSFKTGTNPNESYNGKPLIYEFIGEYTRSPRFSECLATFVEAGLVFGNQLLLATLLNDVNTLETFLIDHPASCQSRFTLPCAYTPLYEVTLLHICAEFNLTDCARTLVRYGAAPDAQAGIDVRGFGGQTPIFHTVNQNSHQSNQMMKYLLTLSPDLLYTVKGFVWGEGYEWETFIPSVNPISYAMMGLLPQMHRNEWVISEVVATLTRQAYGIDYMSPNIPCAYLKK